MDKYKVKLNPRAFREIDDIFAYIALEKLSPENAKGQTDRIWEALKKDFVNSVMDSKIQNYRCYSADRIFLATVLMQMT